MRLSVTVRIPAPLRKVTGEREVVTADDGGSLLEMINRLDKEYPGLKERICDESGEIRRFVNLYINGEDVRFLSGLQTPVKSGDEVSIVPAVAGG
jgi:molybdopterin synthase sulfur carrier subunit